MKNRKPDLRYRPYGRCPDCGYQYKLTKAGLIINHLLYAGDRRIRCEGGGKQPKLEFR